LIISPARKILAVTPIIVPAIIPTPFNDVFRLKLYFQK
jgi:hypothetical protein